MTKLTQAFKAFDNYNQKDPHVFTWDGLSYPQEYFLALKLYEWVLKLDPDADEELLLASRSQHRAMGESARKLSRWQGRLFKMAQGSCNVSCRKSIVDYEGGGI